MKAITVLAAAALLLGVTAASAQTPSTGAGKPGATINSDKDVPAVTGSQTNDAKSTTGMSTQHRSTTGSGSASSATGRTPGSDPNPNWNKNPDTEVPGNTEK